MRKPVFPLSLTRISGKTAPGFQTCKTASLFYKGFLDQFRGYLGNRQLGHPENVYMRRFSQGLTIAVGNGYVPLHARARGVGKILLRRCIEKSTELTASYLSIWVEENDTPRIKLLRKFGFKRSHGSLPSTQFGRAEVWRSYSLSLPKLRRMKPQPVERGKMQVRGGI